MAVVRSALEEACAFESCIINNPIPTEWISAHEHIDKILLWKKQSKTKHTKKKLKKILLYLGKRLSSSHFLRMGHLVY